MKLPCVSALATEDTEEAAVELLRALETELVLAIEDDRLRAGLVGLDMSRAGFDDWILNRLKRRREAKASWPPTFEAARGCVFRDLVGRWKIGTTEACETLLLLRGSRSVDKYSSGLQATVSKEAASRGLLGLHSLNRKTRFSQP